MYAFVALDVLIDVRASTRVWLAALAACVALGFVLATVYAGHPIRPRHFGYYLAIASFVAGLVFGVRGALLPIAGIAAFGAAALINRPPQTPGAEDQTALIVGAFWIYFPTMFGALAAVGAGARAVARLAVRWERS
jgi:hypothetical protein